MFFTLDPGMQDRNHIRLVIGELNSIIQLFTTTKILDASRNRVMIVNHRLLSFERFDSRKPAVLCSTRLIVKIATGPAKNFVAMLFRPKYGPVDEYQPATTLHLALDDLSSIADQEWMVGFPAIATIGYQHDGIGVIECSRLIRPAIKMHFHIKTSCVTDWSQLLGEQQNRFLVFVSALEVSAIDSAGNQHDLLVIVFRSACRNRPVNGQRALHA